MKTQELQRNRSTGIAVLAKAESERRRTIARQFREQMLAELSSVTNTSLGSLARNVFAETATSAYVEMRELSEAFLRGNASGKELVRLGLIRSQLLRTLNALGLVTGPAEPAEEQAGSALEEWASNRQSRKQAPEAADSGPSDGHADASVVKS